MHITRSILGAQSSLASSWYSRAWALEYSVIGYTNQLVVQHLLSDSQACRLASSS